MIARACCALLFATCAARTPLRGNCDGHVYAPEGTVADYALAHGAQIDGVSIAVPRVCMAQHGWAYIRLEREQGARRLGTAAGPSGAFDEGCMEMPDRGDAAACPVINPQAIFAAARTALAEQGIETSGDGAGPCARIEGGYEDWNFSTAVLDWNEAERAVRAVADVLEAYDIAGYVGVAVRGTECVVPAGR